MHHSPCVLLACAAEEDSDGKNEEISRLRLELAELKRATRKANSQYRCATVSVLVMNYIQICRVHNISQD
jgi:hypothetical protein